MYLLQIGLNCPQTDTENDHPILRRKVEAAVQSLKKGKSAGVDNIPAELVQARGKDVITALTTICNQIWQTGEWLTPWIQSLVITLPNKGNLQQCQNYRTISLISHPNKVMLKIILNRLKPQAEKIIAGEQAGISPAPARPLPCFHRLQEGLRQSLACSYVGNHEEVQHQHKPDPSHQKPYKKATSAVLFNGSIKDWFRTTVGV